MIERLYQQGILSDLDIQLGRFMAKLSGGENPEIALAAAMASHYQGEGNICVDLSSFAGKSTLMDGAEGLPFPELKKWRSILKKSPVVGRPGDFRPLILDGSRLYLYRYWDYETKLANILKARTAGDWEKVDEGTLKDGLARLFPEDGEEETDWQKVAAFTSVMKRFCVISGGPGTGKTFTVAKILALLLEQPGAEKIRIALAAPTGKAAARLQEAIKNSKEKLNCREEIKKLIPEEASTIHRLLGSVPDSPYFRHNAENPLSAEVVVVDEASMVDLALLSKLAQAVPSTARLILLGDKDQLASVEAGAVLGDTCDTGKVHGYSQRFCDVLKKIAGENVACPTEGGDGPGIRDSIVQLLRSYRFGVVSGIGEVSRAVNGGDGIRAMDLMKSASYGDIQWKDLPRPEVLPAVLKDRIIEGFSACLGETEPAKVFDLFNRFRILCALREGPHGIHYMNLLIEQILKDEGLIKRDGRWYPGRPVMITRNDYNLRLFNGDVGITLPDPKLGNELRVFFPAPDGSMRTFPPLRLPDHETVYAMTVHKSQGSEFERVLFLMPDRSVSVLTRELVYTAITRAKEKVEVWGKEDVFKGAISRRIERISGLREALWG
ncbi:MAG: exodeoxyribonuclease V subunit alpha [Deltaproteobacteria bacterium]|nr:MAG: exodeoxyribonuclease V subunit alpha [Deltaproteobacteria bacterium]